MISFSNNTLHICLDIFDTPPELILIDCAPFVAIKLSNGTQINLDKTIVRMLQELKL